MRGLKKQRRIQIIILTLTCLLGTFLLIWKFLPDGINLFRSPSQIVASPPSNTEVFKLGGLVVEGSLKQGMGTQFSFEITDTLNVVSVTYVGIDLPPVLFEEGQGTIVTGQWIDGVFQATELLAKHDENYMPKEVIDALKEQGVYQMPIDKVESN